MSRYLKIWTLAVFVDRPLEKDMKTKTNSRLKRRRLGFENLEKRRLLTSVMFPDVMFHRNDHFTVRRDEAEPVELRVNLNDFLPWSDETSVAEETDPKYYVLDADGASVDISSDGQSIWYQPAEGFVGIDVINVVRATTPAQDSTTPESDRIYRSIAVNVVEPLFAVDDWFQVAVNSSDAILGVLENDIRNANYLGPPPEFFIQDAQLDGNGMLSVSPDRKQVVYSPARDFQGVETLRYTAVDGDGYSMVGTAQIRVSDNADHTLWPEQLAQQLIEASVDQYRFRFGSQYYEDFNYRINEFHDPTVVADTSNFSGTNNQISGVDESDRVKTDGEYVYVLSSPDSWDWHGWEIFPRIGMSGFHKPDPSQPDGNMLTVVDVRRPDHPVIVSRQLFDDRVLALDLHGDHLSVISQRGSQTVIDVLNVAAPAEVQTLATTLIDGSFRQARRVEGTLYVFTDEYGPHTPELEANCARGQEYCFFETADQYHQRLTPTELLEALLPSQEVFDADGQRIETVPTIVVDPYNTSLPFRGRRLNIVAMDPARALSGVLDWEISSHAEHILVTGESILTTRTNYFAGHTFEIDEPFFIGIPKTPTITTEIQSFSISEDGTLETSALGAVPGTLNNSFSLDQHDGLVRIATENSWWSVDPEKDGSSIYVLEKIGQELQVIGGVQGLAPGEQIYAVRFAQDRAFVVTFRRVDPLFVIDLTNPVAPEVLGELKAPGYSQYLHIIDKDHLFGVGRDADEETGRYGDLVVSLFNVADPANPRVQDRYEFAGGRTTFSPFAEDDPWNLTDHHAISYFATDGILALPIYSRDLFFEENGDKPIFETPEQSALRTLRIDTTSGITEVDSVNFEQSRVDRSIRIGDYLYSLSADELKVTHLLEKKEPVASLYFERQGQDDFIESNVGDVVTLEVTRNDIVKEEDIEILAADLIEGTGHVEILGGKQIRFSPDNHDLTEHRIRYTARDSLGTLINAIATVDPDLPWHNVKSKLDVNGDDQVTARDALNVINHLGKYGWGDHEQVEAAIAKSTVVYDHLFVDTNDDGVHSTFDALLIIQALGRRAENLANSAEYEAQYEAKMIGSVGDDFENKITEACSTNRSPIDPRLDQHSDRAGA